MTRDDEQRLRRRYRERRLAYEAARREPGAPHAEAARQALNEAIDRLAEAGLWRG